MPEISQTERTALEVLYRAFLDGSPHVAPRTIGLELCATATSLGASRLGGRVATELGRKGLAMRSAPTWNKNPKSVYYRITIAGQKVAAKSV